jgi:hypothetical protein
MYIYKKLGKFRYIFCIYTKKIVYFNVYSDFIDLLYLIIFTGNIHIFFVNIQIFNENT